MHDHIYILFFIGKLHQIFVLDIVPLFIDEKKTPDFLSLLNLGFHMMFVYELGAQLFTSLMASLS